MGIVSAYQERSFAEDVENLQSRGGNVEWLANALASHPRSGISSSEEDLAARRRAFGSNEKAVKEPQSFLSLLIGALDDFILKILIVAACLSIGLEVGVASDEEKKLAWLEGFAILVAVFVCAMVTAVNDYQKERQFMKLNSVADEKKRVSVWRNGLPLELHQDFVLVGDVVAINEGMEVPADGILLESNDITTDESAMTGETDPVQKNILAACAQKLKEVNNENHEEKNEDKHAVPSPVLMSGTRVLTGEGRMIVTVVGPLSCLGKIRALLEKDEEEQTPLQEKL